MASERQTISCVRCGKSNHDINNFLLECASCKRSWHHTCSLPPVSREELVILIQKMTANKLNPSKEAELWRCRRCMKNLGLAIPRTLPQITPSKAEDHTAVTIPSVSSTSVNVSLHRQQTGSPQPTVAPQPGPSRKGKERAEPMRPLTGAGAIDLTVDSSPPQSNRGQKRPTPNVLVSITSPSPPKKTAWDYRDQPHSLIPTPVRGSTPYSNNASPSPGPGGSDRASSLTPFEHMSLANGKTSKSPSIPLAGGTANISALVKSMRKQGQLEPPPIPWATDDVNEFVATSLEDVTTSVGGEEDDHRDITPRDSVRPTSVTPMPARIRMSPSPSVPPPSGLAPDWIRDWKDDGQKDNMEKVQTLWNKYANSRKKQHENRAQSTVSRKPLAKRLGPRGRVSKEQGGVQFIAKEWIAERKSEI